MEERAVDVMHKGDLGFFGSQKEDIREEWHVEAPILLSTRANYVDLKNVNAENILR